MLESDFATLSDVLRAHGRERPDKIAVVDERATYTYSELDRTIDRIAAALQRDGIGPGRSVVIVASASIDYAAVFLGALRADASPSRWRRRPKPETLVSFLPTLGWGGTAVLMKKFDALGFLALAEKHLMAYPQRSHATSMRSWRRWARAASFPSATISAA